MTEEIGKIIRDGNLAGSLKNVIQACFNNLNPPSKK